MLLVKRSRCLAIFSLSEKIAGVATSYRADKLITVPPLSLLFIDYCTQTMRRHLLLAFSSPVETRPKVVPLRTFGLVLLPDHHQRRTSCMTMSEQSDHRQSSKSLAGLDPDLRCRSADCDGIGLLSGACEGTRSPFLQC